MAPAFRKYCLPYVPATTTQLENILSVLKYSDRNGRLLDIGSGDGRIVVGKHFLMNYKKVKRHSNRYDINVKAAAKNGFQSCHGVELNTWLVQYSRIAALASGVSKKTAFYRKDLWKFDVSSYKHIVIFGVEQMVQSHSNHFQPFLWSFNVKERFFFVVCRWQN